MDARWRPLQKAGVRAALSSRTASCLFPEGLKSIPIPYRLPSTARLSACWHSRTTFELLSEDWRAGRAEQKRSQPIRFRCVPERDAEEQTSKIALDHRRLARVLRVWKVVPDLQSERSAALRSRIGRAGRKSGFRYMMDQRAGRRVLAGSGDLQHQ